MHTQNGSGASRAYRKRARAAQELRTRERITRATVALHETTGPGRTTVKAIAERAGVQRATVYRHFPDAQTLFDACTSHYFSAHPMPDPLRWAPIEPESARLRVALGELYAWYGETEQMIFNSLRDMDQVPAATRDAFLGYFDGVRAALMKGRRRRGRPGVRVSAALGHAVSFAAWRSLVREEGVTNEEAVELMAEMVESTAT